MLSEHGTHARRRGALLRAVAVAASGSAGGCACRHEGAVQRSAKRFHTALSILRLSSSAFHYATTSPPFFFLRRCGSMRTGAPAACCQMQRARSVVPAGRE